MFYRGYFTGFFVGIFIALFFETFDKIYFPKFIKFVENLKEKNLKKKSKIL